MGRWLLLLLGSAKDEDVGDGCLIGRHVDGVLDYSGWCFGETTLAIVPFSRNEAELARLLEGLCKGGLAWTGCAAIWSDLGPPFSEQVTKLPTSLDS